MINSLTRFASSLAALLSDKSDLRVNERVDAIGHAMLEALSLAVPDHTVLPELWFKIALATDIHTLWYARIELMYFLSEKCGEEVAKREVGAITAMFAGFIPEAKTSN